MRPPAWEVMRVCASAICPDPRVSLSEWAEREFVLSAESSAETGPFRPWPFQRGILDAISDPAVEIVAVMKSARVGYTKCLGAAIAYHIARAPCPQLVVQPTVEDAEGWSKDELAPMLRDVPSLQGRVADPRARDSGNTILKKSYRGGALSIIGANSPRGFRRLTVRNVYFDEVDGYPASAGGEGDQIALGMKRAETFWNRKIVVGSTPTVKGASRVEAWYLQSDQRRFFVPCPECGVMDYLRWADIRWPEGQPEEAAWCCPSCGSLVPHAKKFQMVERGEWRATAPFRGIAGFHVWAGYSYSPNATWAHIAKELLAAKEQLRLGNIEPMKTWVNTTLGETWETEGETVDWEYLYVRREEFGGDDALPDGVLVITAGVDVQSDRLELQVVGWGDREESWILDYRVLPGDPGQPAVWASLDLELERSWSGSPGRLAIAACGVDAGGHHAQAVYDFCGPREARRVFALRGSVIAGRPIVGKRSKPQKGRRHAATVLQVGTEAAKDVIFARFEVDEDGPGKIHFGEQLEQRYFQQLTAEHAITTYSRGRPARRWVMRPGRQRNEALDTLVYALAALRALNPDWRALVQRGERRAEAVPVPTKPPQEQPVTVLKRPRSRGRKSSGWVDRWR